MVRQRLSTAQTKVTKYIESMPVWQRSIFFLLGVACFVWGFLDIDPSHWGDHGILFAGAEIGLAGVRMLFGMFLMAPPLGMWALRRIPLPKFLDRQPGEGDT